MWLLNEGLAILQNKDSLLTTMYGNPAKWKNILDF